MKAMLTTNYFNIHIFHLIDIHFIIRCRNHT
nr:MAG TPA: hypothetical protein [Caudoviricetes sp.]